MNRLKIDITQAHSRLVKFIREHTKRQGFSRVVLGMSGGLDSTVCAYLAAEALGKENCVGAFLPHEVSNPESLEDAKKIAVALGIRTRQIEITLFVESFQRAFRRLDQVQLGNVMARCRMIVLFQLSAEENALVLGTSNKSELLLGYGTLYGDLACAFDPLGDLYKTQVRALAELLGVPEKILRKTPSADLWKGQSDEAELGLTYKEADRFLVRWVDGHYSRDELLAEGFSPEFTDSIIQLVKSQEFKRRMPPTPKIIEDAIKEDSH